MRCIPLVRATLGWRCWTSMVSGVLPVLEFWVLEQGQNGCGRVGLELPGEQETLWLEGVNGIGGGSAGLHVLEAPR